MSELRERVEKLVALFGGPQLGIERAIFIERIEAFAKEQQVKGLEAAREVCKKNAEATGRYLCALIDAAISKLKEGKT